MIYLCSQYGSLYAHHYYFHNNYIYIIRQNLSNSGCEYFETKYDISKRKFIGDGVRLKNRFMPEYTTPDTLIYTDYIYEIFDILEKMIFDKL